MPNFVLNVNGRRVPQKGYITDELTDYAVDWIGKQGLVAADEDHAVCEQYGVWVEKNNFGKTYFGNQRSSVLVDPEGNVARVFPNVKPAEHDELVLGALRELAA